MTGNNDKITLSVKPGTLGLSKGTSDKLTISSNSHVKSSQPHVTSPKGKVMVVTKATRSTPKRLNNEVKDSELDKKMQLLKNAGEVRKHEQEWREKESAIRASIVESQNVKPVAEESVVPVLHEQVVEERAVEKGIEKISMDNLTGKGRVKNLDAIYKPIRPTQQEAIDQHKPSEAPKHAQEKVALPQHQKLKKSDEADREANANKGEDKRLARKLSVTQVMMMDSEEGSSTRRRSLASIRRAREKHRRKMFGEHDKAAEKIIREVNIPDVITVAELANRMAEKAADVIKSLMKLGMMVTVNQLIDADTAELIVSEFGHKVKRVTEAEIESALMQKTDDTDESLLPRPPVVTVMGHVDHGKTSLLDALRATDVVAGEAGGITQHIGAYQVHMTNSEIITFLDTPGHEAFTAMRMRGAKVTDLVVLVVAADDGIMPQTVEAISHAKAANVPIIVAINKMDKPDANPQKIRNELFMHGLVPDDMGGDTMIVEVSAKQRINLDKLEETILLQAEVLDLKANPNRPAEGAVVESKIEKGRGVVATVLVLKGTLKVGDIIIAGSTYGKIRALINDKGQSINEATPSMPVEISGLEQAPVAGDEFLVVSTEKTARDIMALRLEREKQKRIVAAKSVSLDQLFMRAKADGMKELAVVIKADVQGSIEAIANSIQRLSNDEITVRVLHSAVGGITESDVTLATASKAIIIGFNVRAGQQSREMARVNGIDIRYYSIIYNIVDDIKAAMNGMFSPILKEKLLGYVEIREVFDLSKFGKVAGCYVTEGIIKRSANARIIRDSVVIYDGKLKALKRFKDDVKEVNSGFECGLSFENYEDLRAGDRIEVYEILEQQRTI